MMQFDLWMRMQGLSEASVSKYHYAIKGVLSDWSEEAGIIEGSLLDIKDAAEFSELVLAIKKLPIFKARDSVGNQMYAGALKKYSQYLYYLASSGIDDDIQAVLSDPETTATQKKQLVDARLGQGKYRKELIEFWGACSVTGYSELSVLISSHIKPWSYSGNKEKLDKFNGFLLLPNLDKAFDKGLISFGVNGDIVLSSLLKNPEVLGDLPHMMVPVRELVTGLVSMR